MIHSSLFKVLFLHPFTLCIVPSCPFTLCTISCDLSPFTQMSCSHISHPHVLSPFVPMSFTFVCMSCTLSPFVPFYSLFSCLAPFHLLCPFTLCSHVLHSCAHVLCPCTHVLHPCLAPFMPMSHALCGLLTLST